MTFHSNVRQFSPYANREPKYETFYFQGSEALKFGPGWYVQNLNTYNVYGPYIEEENAILLLKSFEHVEEVTVEQSKDVEDSFFRLVQMSVSDNEDRELVRGGIGCIKKYIASLIPNKVHPVYVGLWFEGIGGDGLKGYANKYRVEHLRGEEVEYIRWDDDMEYPIFD